MSFNHWLQNLRSSLTPGRSQRRHRRRASHRAAALQAGLEKLEDRCLLSFSPVTSLPVDTSPRVVATADFNNDGRLDLATGNYDGTVSVLMGDGQGGFGAASQFAAESIGRSLAVGDFNNDGNPDLATNVSVRLGNGDGTFRPPVNIDRVGYDVPHSVAVGDFNSDGNTDLVYSALGFTNSGSVAMLFGDGEGGFWFWSDDFYELQGVYPNGLAVGDLNGDGKPDVVTADYYDGTVSVLLGDGDGTLSYSPGSSDFGTGQSPWAVTIGDFTGDGIPDLVTAGQTVDILPGLGDGTFAPPIHHSTNGTEMTTVAAADFDGDTQLDVVTADQWAGTVSVLLGLGDGTLTPPIDHAAGSAPRAVAVGDFNGDGRPDVAAADRGSNAVSVLLNDGLWSPQPPTLPTIGIGDVTLTEGNTGSAATEFTVTLSAASTEMVTVAYGTVNGTAMAGSDYQTASGTLTFAPGEISQTISVPVLGDTVFEPNETFFVSLTNPSGATIADGQGTGTIVNDDTSLPRLTISDVTKKEGHKGKVSFTFTVTLSAPSTQNVTVQYATANGTATVGNSDYTAKSGSLTFQPGQTSKSITVSVRGDKKAEADETFFVNLSSAQNALIDDGQGVGTILNDDGGSLSLDAAYSDWDLMDEVLTGRKRK